jgi:hypothetical protein
MIVIDTQLLVALSAVAAFAIAALGYCVGVCERSTVDRPYSLEPTDKGRELLDGIDLSDRVISARMDLERRSRFHQ